MISVLFGDDVPDTIVPALEIYGGGGYPRILGLSPNTMYQQPLILLIVHLQITSIE
jgi:hypothetical protein